MLTESYIQQVLEPLKTPFNIKYNGTSQTHPKNHGRFGFKVESIFGVVPNSHQGADLGHTEIKCVQKQLGKFKDMSIGILSQDEYNWLHNSTAKVKFDQSVPFQKMKQTLFVSYAILESGDNPLYGVLNWKNVSLDKLPHNIRIQLQADYDYCVYMIQNSSYSRLKTESFCPRGATKYLSLSRKGDQDYVYPVWKFKAAFLRDILQ